MPILMIMTMAIYDNDIIDTYDDNDSVNNDYDDDNAYTNDDDNGNLPQEARRFFRQIISALDFCHRCFSNQPCKKMIILSAITSQLY